ncbi:MAG: bifunctional DNA-formamidopyrimidine glycosylase/DNA-(apurinic or apyrimidinic site) lyase [Thermoanaerobaculia bacterium]
MPELPELEVLRRSLEPHLVGERIERARVWNGSLREPVDRRKLARATRGRQIMALGRRAKYLLLELEQGSTLVIHLGMSGRLTLVPASAPRETHEHLGFFLASGRRLRFRDPRRFGLVLALPSRTLERDRHFRHLGVEPLVHGFDGGRLAALARGRRAPVKSFLMDGRLVVGLGNIYATEALFRSGIHPARSVARISRKRWERLARSVRETLEQAIAEGGTTLNDFTDGEGRAGDFQVSLAVYGRDGAACPRCGKPVRRIVQAGRSSFYCPGCQR